MLSAPLQSQTNISAKGEKGAGNSTGRNETLRIHQGDGRLHDPHHENGTSRIGNGSGRVKVICLSHKVLVYFTDDPGTRVWLYPGQMSDIRVKSKNLPSAVTVNHGLLLASSMLGEKGGFGPLPSQALLELIASKQASVPVDVPPIGHSETSSNSQIQDANLQAQAVQTAELTTVSNNDSQASSPSGKSGNKGSNGNKGNIENRGNSEYYVTCSGERTAAHRSIADDGTPLEPP